MHPLEAEAFGGGTVAGQPTAGDGVRSAVQGAAAAVSVPRASRLLLHVTPDPGGRRTALALWSASGAVAGVLGYIVGGVLTETFGWRAMYGVNAPIGIALLAGPLGSSRLCQPRSATGGSTSPGRSCSSPALWA